VVCISDTKCKQCQHMASSANTWCVVMVVQMVWYSIDVARLCAALLYACQVRATVEGVLVHLLPPAA
jgi:hypothetical protein